MAIVAIVGRPNVGKSTLFNRLVGRRVALVDERPGVTRDRRIGEGRIGKLAFTAVDTAGLEEAPPAAIEARMRTQSETAVRDADLVLFLIDGREGVTSMDRHFANWLRRLGKKVIVVANKCESAAAAHGVGEAHGLGLGGVIAISAEHGLGLPDLAEAINAKLPVDAEDAAAEEDGDRAIRVAIVGRPNVGKSTLVNRLLGEERMLTGPEPGLTRDAIDIAWTWRKRRFVLVDTAGLRKKARIDDRVEKMAASSTIEAIKRAHVVVLLIDATQPLERQDLQIGRLVAEEGRALVIAANKWDLIENGPKTLRALGLRVEDSLPQFNGVAVVTIAGLTGLRLDTLMGAIAHAHDVWNSEIATPKLNRWLGGVTEAHPPPMVRGRRPRLRFVRQVAQRPPTFAIFGSSIEGLADDYQRFLANSLRKIFGLEGAPIRLQMRQTENPFEESKPRSGR